MRKEKDFPKPVDSENEAFIIGVCLLDPDSFPVAAEIIRGPADFEDPLAQATWAAMRAVYADQGEVYFETVEQELRRRRDLEAFPDTPEDITDKLRHLRDGYGPECEGVPAALRRRCSIQRERAVRWEAAEKIGAVAYDLGRPLEQIIGEYLEALEAMRLAVAPPDQGTISAADYGKIARERTSAWAGWLPRGELTILGGDTGLGKSIDALYLGAAHTGQVPWPDGADPPEPGARVFWCDCEGREWDTWDRLNEWNLDPAPFIFPGADGTAAMSINLGLPGAPEALAAQAAGAGCDFLVLDSLSASHSLNENSASEMGPMLKACKDAARKHNLVWLATHHANKPGQLQGPEMDVNRLRGSSAIKQWCVSVIGVDQVIDGRDQPPRFRSLKLNFGRPPEDLGFCFEGDNSKPVWGPAPTKPVVLTAQDQAVEFLLGQLRGGPRTVREIHEAADRAGLAKSAIDKARGKLRIEPKQAGFHGGWVWALPEHRLSE
jgi:hypothetical protein